MSLQDEIKSMAFGSPFGEMENDDEQDTDDSLGDEELGEEEAGEETEGGEEEESSEDASPAPKADAEETLEERYARLLVDLNAANARLLGLEQSHPQVQHSAQQPDPATLLTEKKIEIPGLTIDKELVQKALIESDVDAFMQILQMIASHSNSVSETYYTNSLRSVPEMATNMALSRVRLQNAVDAFYKDNSDLIPHSATVGMITNKVVSDNPQFGLEEVFTEVEKNARKILGLKKKVEVDQQTAGRKNFAKKGGSRKPGAQTLTGLRGEIAAMASARR